MEKLIMATAREIMDQENKKKDEAILAQTRNEYAALLYEVKLKEQALVYGATNTTNYEDEIDKIFRNIHEQLSTASAEAPLLKDMLHVFAKCADDFQPHLPKNQKGIMQAETLQKAVSATLNPNITSEEKFNAVAAFVSINHETLYGADDGKRSGFSFASCLGFGLAGALVGLLVTGIVIATGGAALIMLLPAALAGFMAGSILVGMPFGLGKKLDMPSTIGTKLNSVTQQGFFAPKLTPPIEQDTALEHQNKSEQPISIKPK